MAITKIEVPELFDFGSDNSAFKLPTGTTAERPTSPSNGEMRFNTTTGFVEYYDTTNTQWWEIDYAPPPFVASDNFNIVLYTGSGTSTSVTGVGFEPDLVWGKARNSSSLSHILFDVVRGENKQISSDLYDAQVVRGSAAYLFDSDGFTVTTAGNLNNPNNFVAWCWKAGGAAVSNTDGTIASQVSANTAAGFSIVEYTGSGASGATVGHGLGKPPELIIVKALSTSSWAVYSEQTGISKFLELNYIYGTSSYSNFWGAAVPTNDVFGVAPGNFSNNLTGQSLITYCFTSISGYSKIGTYTGTGGALTVYTTDDGSSTGANGFQPAFVMIKRTDSSGSWVMVDNKRANGDSRLYANLANAEDTGQGESFISNGFKPRQTTTNDTNTSGGTYIYMAIAAT